MAESKPKNEDNKDCETKPIDVEPIDIALAQLTALIQSHEAKPETLELPADIPRFVTYSCPS